MEERSSGLSEEGPPPGPPLSSVCVELVVLFEIERRRSTRHTSRGLQLRDRS